MAKLILTKNGIIKQEYVLASESMSIGRKSSNDIQLNDLTVSGRHSLITTLRDHTYIEDLGSTNGTILNGKRIIKALLQQCDIIQIGTHIFTYYAEENSAYEPTMFIQAEFDETKIIDSQPAGLNIKGEPLAAIKILDGPLATKVLELRKPFTTLGFDGKKLAMISRTVTGYSITSLNDMRFIHAADSPVLNGNRVENEAIKLKDHDIIEIAATKTEFFYLQ